MARLARAPVKQAREVGKESGEEEEEFPELEVVLNGKRPAGTRDGNSKTSANVEDGDGDVLEQKMVKKMVKKRVLGKVSENPLMQKLGESSASAGDALGERRRGVRPKVRGSGRFEAYLELERGEQFGGLEEVEGGDGVGAKGVGMGMGKWREGGAPVFELKAGSRERVEGRDAKPERKAVVGGRKGALVRESGGEEEKSKTKISGMRKATPVVNSEEEEKKLKPKRAGGRKGTPEVDLGSEDQRPKRKEAVKSDIAIATATEVDSGSEDQRPRRREAIKSKIKIAAATIVDSDGSDSDGMSDFVVDDDSEDESVVEIPPPRSVRRLVRGRRPLEDEDDGLDLEMDKLHLDTKDEDSDPFEIDTRKSRKYSEEVSDVDIPVRKREPAQPKKVPPFKQPSSQTSPDCPDPFTLRLYPTLPSFHSPPESKLKPNKPSSPSPTKPRVISKQTRFTTPPGSPIIKPRLKSPTKLPRMPSTPHHEHMDDFWAQDVINEWNDEYSPRKIPQSPTKKSSSADAPGSPKKSPMKEARISKDAKKFFAQRKHAIADAFLQELDATITKGKVAELAASTGGVKIIWSKKLNTTAGRANWKRETIRSSSHLGPDGKPLITFRHHASIELAEKVIDDEDRLLNVLAHEFCHLANFMVSNVKTNPHGKEFKAWAAKCGRAFGGRGVEVTTKHSYEIEYRFVWECVNCGLEFGRHSRSIDPRRHQCGRCKSKLVQTKPTPKAGDEEGGEKVLGGYQLFVKENMAAVRKENPKSPQKELMGLIGKRYQELKAAGKAGGAAEKQRDEVEDVVRKLDFLDLTSP